MGSRAKKILRLALMLENSKENVQSREIALGDRVEISLPQNNAEDMIVEKLPLPSIVNESVTIVHSSTIVDPEIPLTTELGPPGDIIDEELSFPSTISESVTNNVHSTTIADPEIPSTSELGPLGDITFSELVTNNLHSSIIVDRDIPSTSGIRLHGDIINEQDLFEDSGSSFEPSSDSESSVEYKENKPRRLKILKRNLRGREENHSLHKVEEPKKKRAKKGESDPSSWKRNRQKALRMKGDPYVIEIKGEDGSIHKKERKPREMKEQGCVSKRCLTSKDKRLCSTITNDQRREIFHRFWSDLDWKQRKVFVCTLVNQQHVREKKTTKAVSRRTNSLRYHLKNNNELKPVCKKMFLSTLGIGEWTVHNWVKNAHSSGIAKSLESFPLKVKAINAECRRKIVEFFEQLPKLPSHYCRSSTDKMYLQTDFHSYSEVYQLYKNEVNRSFVTSINVFLSEMRKLNIDLFHPRKDQCDLCFSHKMGNVIDEVYKKHLASKERAEKQTDKLDAIAGNLCALTVDVQAVQLVPHVQAGMVYFKQKLACHNYTLYNLKTDKVVCYVWHEGEGGMDGNCFASCLTDYLEKELEDDTGKPIIIYSDGCGAQNRNVTLSNALLHFAIIHQTDIIQKFLVKGHSQMECDSVHSTIERRMKNRDIYSPSNYVEIIKEARQKKSQYQVKYVNHEFFKDYSAIKSYSSIRPGKKVGDSTVNDLRALKYCPNGDIQYKLDFDEDWKPLPQRNSSNIGEIKNLYKGPLPIKGDKYNHLQSLKVVIPADYHGFYDPLVH